MDNKYKILWLSCLLLMPKSLFQIVGYPANVQSNICKRTTKPILTDNDPESFLQICFRFKAFDFQVTNKKPHSSAWWVPIYRGAMCGPVIITKVGCIACSKSLQKWFCAFLIQNLECQVQILNIYQRNNSIRGLSLDILA